MSVPVLVSRCGGQRNTGGRALRVFVEIVAVRLAGMTRVATKHPRRCGQVASLVVARRLVPLLHPVIFQWAPIASGVGVLRHPQWQSHWYSREGVESFDVRWPGTSTRSAMCPRLWLLPVADTQVIVPFTCHGRPPVGRSVPVSQRAFVQAAAMKPPGDHESSDGDHSQEVRDATVPPSRNDTHDDAYTREHGCAECDLAQPGGRHGRDLCTRCADSGIRVRFRIGPLVQLHPSTGVRSALHRSTLRYTRPGDMRLGRASHPTSRSDRYGPEKGSRLCQRSAFGPANTVNSRVTVRFESDPRLGWTGYE
jgi:hypothetical protein